MKRFLLPLLLVAPTAWGGLFLNEIRLDQTGADNDEYFEIFSSDYENDSLADVVLLVIGDGTGGSGVIESVTSLDGQTLTSPWFLVAESTFTMGTPSLSLPAGDNPLNFENSDNVTYVLVRDFTGANGDDLDTNDDGVLDSMPWSVTLDAVAILETTETPPTSTEWAYPGLGSSVGPDGDFVPGHIYRSPDGGDWQIGQFDPVGGQDTPGAANPAAVPEPSTNALFLLGAGALFLRRKSSRR
ncbi:MAG: PEP-CTERM sorting domain-containing protein [Verrucomicrobiales bacterium]|nr:PEP-CTERM sorting domain-containing protein [Verrucomicrobiales bacterium]